MKISPRVRAALFARGLVAALDVSDDVCLAALTAFAAGRGDEVPAEEAAQLKLLNGQTLIAATAVARLETTAPAANVKAAHDAEIAEAKLAGQKTEAERQKAIRASAELLGLGEPEIKAAIDGLEPHATVIAGWHKTLGEKEKPIGQVNVGQAGIEKYMEVAANAVMLHVGQEVPQALLTPEIQQLARAPLAVHAERCLSAAGVRFDPYDREAMMQKAFAMDGVEGFDRQEIRADIPYNRPGSFPNLLSNIANKILDEGVEQADTHYDEWTGRWPGDLPDFKAVPVVAKGKYGETDEVLDAEEFKEQGLSEECLSMMQLARYGNAFALTPVLAANDDLEAFVENLIGLSEGWELRQNRGCVNLITGNAVLLDGNALYDDTNHLNHIASGGGVPSDSEWDNMEIKLSKQTVIGGKAYARGMLAIAFVPPKLWRPAVQTFMTPRDAFEAKAAAADTSLSVYRGLVTVVKEPELAAASEVEWYGFSNPKRFANATVVRAYFRGFPVRGKRERWYDPRTKCWYVSLEGRAGFAVKNYRTTIKNKGAA